MAITVGTSNSTNASGANSITLGITVAAGVDGLDLDIDWSDGTPGTLDSVTVNGSTTGVAHIVTAAGGGAFSQYLRASKYRCLAPSTGAQNVVATFSASQGEMQLGCTQLTGLHQTTPVRDSDSTTGDDATAGPLTLTTESGDYVSDNFNGGAFNGANNPTITFGAGQTSRWQDTALATIIQAGGSYETASGVTAAMDCTIVEPGETIFAHAYVAASYIPAGAAATAGPLANEIPLKTLVGGSLAH
jgi:hypothetical protein